MVHIFTAPSQPATHFRTEFGLLRFKSRRLAYCRNCGRRRQMKNLTVQVFYDDIRFFCRVECKRRRR